MERNQKILAKIEKSMRILEIGPSLAPIASKSVFNNVYTVDHASKEDLVRKYQGQGLNAALIEDVDFIWTSGSLHETIPAALHGTFDAVICSHVFEHIPDPIRFLQSLGILLHDGGVLSMANPDKRYCFDFLKATTSTGDMIEAFENKRTRHSTKTLFQQRFDSVSSDNQLVWAEWLPAGDLRFIDNELGGYESQQAPTEESVYIDCHAWYFTPSSFDLIILELHEIGLIPFQIDLSFQTWGCEFYRTLVKSDAHNHTSTSLCEMRLSLHKRIFDELRVQFDTWRGSTLPKQ